MISVFLVYFSFLYREYFCWTLPPVLLSSEDARLEQAVLGMAVPGAGLAGLRGAAVLVCWVPAWQGCEEVWDRMGRGLLL